MNEHRYILEPYKGMNTRHHCPGCNSKDKTYSLYIDTDTGQHVHATVGRCNRESNCGYHVTPKQYFTDNNIQFETVQQVPRIETPKREPSFIAPELFKQSLRQYEQNNFVNFLISLFGEAITGELIERYFIGTSKHWPGSTIFWQIGSDKKIRTGKIMLYDTITGKRIKEPFNHIQWVHKLINQPEFELKQCLFGEHLLIDKIKPAAIVESEKTAIISSVYLPQFLWLAVGSLTNLNFEKCLILAGRKVVLYPDLNGFDKWTAKAKELTERIPGTKFVISDLLERSATEAERANGLDLADYLVRFNLEEFRDKQSEKVIQVELAPDDSPEPSSYHCLNSCQQLHGHIDSLSFVESLPFYP